MFSIGSRARAPLSTVASSSRLAPSRALARALSSLDELLVGATAPSWRHGSAARLHTSTAAAVAGGSSEAATSAASSAASSAGLLVDAQSALRHEVDSLLAAVRFASSAGGSATGARGVMLAALEAYPKLLKALTAYQAAAEAPGVVSNGGPAPRPGASAVTTELQRLLLAFGEEAAAPEALPTVVRLLDDLRTQGLDDAAAYERFVGAHLAAQRAGGIAGAAASGSSAPGQPRWAARASEPLFGLCNLILSDARLALSLPTHLLLQVAVEAAGARLEGPNKKPFAWGLLRLAVHREGFAAASCEPLASVSSSALARVWEACLAPDLLAGMTAPATPAASAGELAGTEQRVEALLHRLSEVPAVLGPTAAAAAAGARVGAARQAIVRCALAAALGRLPKPQAAAGGGGASQAPPATAASGALAWSVATSHALVLARLGKASSPPSPLPQDIAAGLVAHRAIAKGLSPAAVLSELDKELLQAPVLVSSAATAAATGQALRLIAEGVFKSQGAAKEGLAFVELVAKWAKASAAATGSSGQSATQLLALPPVSAALRAALSAFSGTAESLAFLLATHPGSANPVQAKLTLPLADVVLPGGKRGAEVDRRRRAAASQKLQALAPPAAAPQPLLGTGSGSSGALALAAPTPSELAAAAAFTTRAARANADPVLVAEADRAACRAREEAALAPLLAAVRALASVPGAAAPEAAAALAPVFDVALGLAVRAGSALGVSSVLRELAAGGHAITPAGGLRDLTLAWQRWADVSPVLAAPGGGPEANGGVTLSVPSGVNGLGLPSGAPHASSRIRVTPRVALGLEGVAAPLPRGATVVTVAAAGGAAVDSFVSRPPPLLPFTAPQWGLVLTSAARLALEPTHPVALGGALALAKQLEALEPATPSDFGTSSSSSSSSDDEAGVNKSAAAAAPATPAVSSLTALLSVLSKTSALTVPQQTVPTAPAAAAKAAHVVAAEASSAELDGAAEGEDGGEAAGRGRGRRASRRRSGAAAAAAAPFPDVDEAEAVAAQEAAAAAAAAAYVASKAQPVDPAVAAQQEVVTSVLGRATLPRAQRALSETFTPLILASAAGVFGEASAARLSQLPPNSLPPYTTSPLFTHAGAGWGGKLPGAAAANVASHLKTAVDAFEGLQAAAAAAAATSLPSVGSAAYLALVEACALAGQPARAARILGVYRAERSEDATQAIAQPRASHHAPDALVRALEAIALAYARSEASANALWALAAAEREVHHARAAAGTPAAASLRPHVALAVVNALADTRQVKQALQVMRWAQTSNAVSGSASLAAIDQRVSEGVLCLSGALSPATVTAVLYDSLHALRKAVSQGVTPAPQRLKIYHAPHHRLHIRGVLQSLRPPLAARRAGKTADDYHLAVDAADAIAFFTAPVDGDDEEGGGVEEEGGGLDAAFAAVKRRARGGLKDVGSDDDADDASGLSRRGDFSSLGGAFKAGGRGASSGSGKAFAFEGEEGGAWDDAEADEDADGGANHGSTHGVATAVGLESDDEDAAGGGSSLSSRSTRGGALSRVSSFSIASTAPESLLSLVAALSSAPVFSTGGFGLRHWAPSREAVSLLATSIASDATASTSEGEDGGSGFPDEVEEATGGTTRPRLPPLLKNSAPSRASEAAEEEYAAWYGKWALERARAAVQARLASKGRFLDAEAQRIADNRAKKKAARAAAAAAAAEDDDEEGSSWDATASSASSSPRRVSSLFEDMFREGSGK